MDEDYAESRMCFELHNHKYLQFELNLCNLGLRTVSGGDSEHYKTLLGASNGPVQAEKEFL